MQASRTITETHPFLSTKQADFQAVGSAQNGVFPDRANTATTENMSTLSSEDGLTPRDAVASFVKENADVSKA